MTDDSKPSIHHGLHGKRIVVVPALVTVEMDEHDGISEAMVLLTVEDADKGRRVTMHRQAAGDEKFLRFVEEFYASALPAFLRSQAEARAEQGREARDDR